MATAKVSFRHKLFKSPKKDPIIPEDTSNLATGQAPAPTPVQPVTTQQEPSTESSELDREQGSVNTSLTASNRRTPFYRRKSNKSSTSADALTSNSSGTSHSILKPASGPARSRPSFISRVVQKVVPCVPSTDSQVLNPQDGVEHIALSSSLSPSSPPAGAAGTGVAGVATADIADQQPRSTTALKELTIPKAPEISAQKSSGDDDDQESPAVAAGFITPPVTPYTPPDPEAEILVPPPVHTHLLPDDETDGLTSGAVQPPGSSGTESIVRSHSHDSEDSDAASLTDEEELHMQEEIDEEERLIRNGGSGIPIGPDGTPKPLLPPIAPEHAGRKCLVLDLDETLVHSSFKAVQQADFIVPVEIEYHWHHFHVLKRPGVDNFLKKMGELYEIVVFTASLSKYADPVLDKLDIHHVVAHRLFRESCYNHKGNYVKDLSQLGRPVSDTIILDNSPASYIFHPNNAVPVSSWFNDPHDAELTDLIPFLADLTSVPDIRGILDGTR